MISFIKGHRSPALREDWPSRAGDILEAIAQSRGGPEIGGSGFGVWCFGVWGSGFGFFRVWGSGFRVQSLGFLEFGVQGLGRLEFGVQGLGFFVWGLGFTVWCLGFGVQGHQVLSTAFPSRRRLQHNPKPLNPKRKTLKPWP